MGLFPCMVNKPSFFFLWGLNFSYSTLSEKEKWSLFLKVHYSWRCCVFFFHYMWNDDWSHVAIFLFFSCPHFNKIKNIYLFFHICHVPLTILVYTMTFRTTMVDLKSPHLHILSIKLKAPHFIYLVFFFSHMSYTSQKKLTSYTM